MSENIIIGIDGGKAESKSIVLPPDVEEERRLKHINNDRIKLLKLATALRNIEIPKCKSELGKIAETTAYDRLQVMAMGI